jgi:glyoxylase-like metal-dependent hydrolase (beta-lactamase superfamily II)
MNASSPEVVRSASEPFVHSLFEKSTETWTWLVADPISRDAVIIDPVLDGKSISNPRGISTTAADQLLEIIIQYRYRVLRILETHSQRQHATSAWYLRTQLQDMTGCMPRICTGKSMKGVQRMFERQYRITNPFEASLFNNGFKDGDGFDIGHIRCQVIHLSGPDPDRFGFVIGRSVFTGSADGKTDAEPECRAVKRLSAFAEGYFFHPQNSTLGAAVMADILSRPTTARTTSDVSAWQHEPLQARQGPLGTAKAVHNYSRPRSQVHEIGV